MPFGALCEYDDFDDCVNRNLDKEDPAGYCSVIQRETEESCARGRDMVRHNNRAVNLYKQKMLSRIGVVDPKLENAIRHLRLPWYQINTVSDAGESDDNVDGINTNVTDDETTEILIYDEIGGSFGVSALEFVEELQNITTPKIDVRINSPGGNLFDSIAIYNALVHHTAYVTTYVDAIAASGASIVAMAGDKCVMMIGSQMMIHDASGNLIGNAQEMRDMAIFLDKQSMNVASIYANKADGTPAEWRERMIAETWMFASEALELGLADEVYVQPKRDAPAPGVPSEPEPEPETEPAPEPEPTPKKSVPEEPMNRKHRTTNRGYKYTSRDKAPNPIDRLSIIEQTQRALRRV
jgi:ATP-dependent protease ClpP protease subunit